MPRTKKPSPQKADSAVSKQKNTKKKNSASRRKIPGGGSSVFLYPEPDEEMQSRFEGTLQKIVGADRERPTIGTLSEKTVHAVVKNYFEPDEDHQEIPIEKYVADIYRGGEILEIQTRQMGRLKEKLSCFLPNYQVTVVHPVLHRKTLIWVDPDTGEMSKPRKTGKIGTVYTAFSELYLIRDFLTDPNLRVTLLLMDMTEYKLLNGRSKDRKHFGAERFDRIPTSLISQIDLNCPEDYMQFIPEHLEEEFTSLDFAREAHIPRSLASNILQVFHMLGIITRIGTRGRAYLYRCTY